jgi:hypothetical protein
MPRRADLIGKTFGRLGVVEYSHSQSNAYWRCVCVCRNEVVVDTISLTSGNTRSCGCLRREVASVSKFKHGHSNSAGKRASTKAYMCWRNMIRRCSNEKCVTYSSYGGRGIKVCDRWLVFENFLADMGEPPLGKEIDRIDNDGNYEPRNCRWATKLEQAANKRTSSRITYRGETKSIPEWAKIIGISAARLRQRLWYGWSIDDAMTRPVDHERFPGRLNRS